MMDPQRFQLAKASPESAHRLYHGGGLVDVVLAIADLWKKRSEARRSRVFGLRTPIHSSGSSSSAIHRRDSPA